MDTEKDTAEDTAEPTVSVVSAFSVISQYFTLLREYFGEHDSIIDPIKKAQLLTNFN